VAGVLIGNCGPSSSVGIVTDYGLDGPGIECRWGRDFLPVQTGPGAHPASCTMGTVSFPRVNCGRGVLLTTHPLVAPRSWKSRAIPLPTLWATTGPVTGLLYLNNYKTVQYSYSTTTQTHTVLYTFIFIYPIHFNVMVLSLQ
jgi:hypothetical protein